MEERTNNFKDFIPENALFELQLPIEFDFEKVETKIDNTIVHTFINYKNGLILYLSYVYDIKNILYKDKITLNKCKYMYLRDNISGICEKKYFNYHFIITFNYFPKDTLIDLQKIEIDINFILNSIKLIDKNQKNSTYFFYKYSNFIESLYATNILYENAIKRNCLLEVSLLIINRIDAMLRISIILKKQLLNTFDYIEDLKYIYQKDKNGIIERAIYNTAKEIGIITNDIHKSLGDAYDYRNNIIHKFIITNINIAGITSFISNLIELQLNIYNIVDNLENEQIEKNIGMTKNYADIIKNKDIYEIKLDEELIKNIAIISKLNNKYQSTK